jgi:hypothetical protein
MFLSAVSINLWSYCVLIVCLILARQPPVGNGLIINEVSRSHKTTHHCRYNSSGSVISSSQRPLPESTQNSQQKNIHAPGGIRTHNLSRRAAADLRLRPRRNIPLKIRVTTFNNIYAGRSGAVRVSIGTEIWFGPKLVSLYIWDIVCILHTPSPRKENRWYL